jgi:ribosomal protein L11 methyltransferase
VDFGPAFIGNWEEDGWSFLFFKERRDSVVAAWVDSQPALSLIERYAMSYDEWLGERFEGFDTEVFSIRPPWVRTPKIDAQNGTVFDIVLDPGVVFGTGTHTTTRDCLTAMSGLFARAERPWRVVDLGTGSGLLSVAAARLGAEKVVAVDLNPLAVRTAFRNIRLNGLEDRVIAVQGRAENIMVGAPIDLLIANIHFPVMALVVASPVFWTTPFFILSGLLRSQVRAVEALFRNRPVSVIEKRSDDGIWTTLMGRTTFQ